MSRPASRSSSKNPSGCSTIRCPCSGRAVTGRRLATTTAPSAIGGTKWPSMMSTWNTPTCGSTAATCAPRFAKSAARIDAATVPIAGNGTGRGGHEPTGRGPTTPAGTRPRTCRRSPCRWGQRRCRSAGPSGPRVITGRRSARARSRASHTASVSTRVNVQTAYTSRPPAAVASAAAETIASCRAASPASASFGTRHSSSGRRRADPSPLQGASTRTRSNGPVTAGRRGVLGDEQRRGVRAAGPSRRPDRPAAARCRPR